MALLIIALCYDGTWLSRHLACMALHIKAQSLWQLLMHCTLTRICQRAVLLLQASHNKLNSDRPLFNGPSKPWYPPFRKCVLFHVLMLLILARCWGRQGEVLGFEEDRQAQLAAGCPLSWGHPLGASTGPHPYPPHQEQGNIPAVLPSHWYTCCSNTYLNFLAVCMGALITCIRWDMQLHMA